MPDAGKGETEIMSEMYLGVEISENRLSVAVTENAEPVATLDEPLNPSSFDRFCKNAITMISELAQEYSPRAISVTGVPNRILYLDADGHPVSGLLPVPENADKHISRIYDECGRTLSLENGLLSYFADADGGSVPSGSYTFATLSSYICAALCERSRPVFHASEAFDVGFYSFEKKDFDNRAVVKCRLAGLRYPEVSVSPSVVGYLGSIPVTVALGRTQARFLGSADRGGALVELRKNEFASYFASKTEKQPVGTVRLPFSEGYDLFVKRDFDSRAAYEALLSFVARVSVSVGGTEDVAGTVGELALSALNETSLPKLRFEQGRLKLSADFEGFTPDRLCAAFIKEVARRLCFVSKTPTRLVLSGKSRFDCEAFRRSLAHAFGVEAACPDMAFAAAAGAARFAAEAVEKI